MSEPNALPDPNDRDLEPPKRKKADDAGVDDADDADDDAEEDDEIEYEDSRDEDKPEKT
jgi:hypothetical protein